MCGVGEVTASGWGFVGDGDVEEAVIAELHIHPDVTDFSVVLADEDFFSVDIDRIAADSKSRDAVIAVDAVIVGDGATVIGRPPVRNKDFVVSGKAGVLEVWVEDEVRDAAFAFRVAMHDGADVEEQTFVGSAFDIGNQMPEAVFADNKDFGVVWVFDNADGFGERDCREVVAL